MHRGHARQGFVVFWSFSMEIWSSSRWPRTPGWAAEEADPAENEEQGAKASLPPRPKREGVRTWSSWAAKRGRKGDNTKIVHTSGMLMAESLSEGQYEHGEGPGCWKRMRRSEERQSSEVLLITKAAKSIISIPEMWKDSHREPIMEKYHEPKPDLCRDTWQDMVPSCGAACIALLCSAVSKTWGIQRQRKNGKCHCLPFADVGWESRGLGKPFLPSWWLSL